MKKLVAIVLAFVIIVTLGSAAFAQDEITVLVNNYILEFDVPPQIIDGRTMVPMRKIFEAYGATVDWVAEMNLVLAAYNTNIIAMPINEYSFLITDAITNETKTVTLDVPVQVVDGRTLVPVRAISEAMGKSVTWDDATKTVVISD